MTTAISESAAWCWFQSPSLLRLSDDEGSLILGVQGEQYQEVFQMRNGAVVAHSVLGSRFPYHDDHNQPALLEREDGHILAVYAHHNYPHGTQARVSLAPHDVSAFSAEAEVDTYQIENCYPSPICINGALYVIVRRIGANQISNWALIPVDETGTLNGTRLAVWYGGAVQRYPYLRWVSDGSKLHFFATESHQRNAGKNFTLRHFVFDGVAWKDSFGGDITDQNGFGPYSPEQHSDATLVYDGVGIDSSWVNDAAIDASGNPMALFQVAPGEDYTDHRLYFGRLINSQWEVGEIWQMGRSMASSEHPSYSGNASFDRENPRRIITTGEVNGRLELFELTTTDYDSWQPQQLTYNSAHDNTRPLASGPDVIWMGGEYGSYTTYQTKALWAPNGDFTPIGGEEHEIVIPANITFSVTPGVSGTIINWTD